MIKQRKMPHDFIISTRPSFGDDFAHCQKLGGCFLHTTTPPCLEWKAGGADYYLIGKVGAKTPHASIKACTSKADFLKIEGRYAVIKYNAKDDGGGEISIWADRYSRRDIYYSPQSSVQVASNLNHFDDVDWKQTPDLIGLAHSLCIYGSRPAKQQTFNANIARLGLGQSLTIKDAKTFDVTNAPADLLATKSTFGIAELERYKDLFFDAIKAQGSEDGNIVFLSSGWDSTAIATVLVHVFGKDKVCGVIGEMRYSESTQGFNHLELEKADKFAEYLGIDLHRTPLDYTEDLDEIVSQAKTILTPHHCHSLTGFNHIKLNAKAVEIKNGDEAVFAGEISDAAHNLGFSQYTTIHHPYSYDFREYSDKMASYLFGPTFLTALEDGNHDKDPVWTLFKTMNSGFEFETAKSGDGLKLQILSNFFLRQTRTPLLAAENIKILSPDGLDQFIQKSEDQYLKPMVSADFKQHLYSIYLNLYHSFHWQGGTIASLEICADYFGLDFNLPFLDCDVLSLLEAMPESAGRGLDFNPAKYPLKWMLEHCTDYPMELQKGPHAYLFDVDVNFNPSAEITYRSRFNAVFKDALKDRSFIDALPPSLLNASYVDGLIDQFNNDVEVKGIALADTLSLGLHSVLNNETAGG